MSLFAKSKDKEMVLEPERQIRAWQKAARQMGGKVFDSLSVPAPPGEMPAEIKNYGWLGPFLFLGLGDDGQGNADAVLSGGLAWRMLKRRRGKTWRCEYADFNRPEDMRLRPEAPPRPKGYYWAWLHPGEEGKTVSIARMRQAFKPPQTGLAAEGLQLLAVTHPHWAGLMEKEELPFMALADFDVAPHGFNDFCESPQLFKSQGVLGMGVGNVDGLYPRFGIPRLWPIGWGGDLEKG